MRYLLLIELERSVEILILTYLSSLTEVFEAKRDCMPSIHLRLSCIIVDMVSSSRSVPSTHRHIICPGCEPHSSFSADNTKCGQRYFLVKPEVSRYGRGQ